MGENELMQAISTVGFPIVAYLLVVLRTDKSMKDLTEAVNNNTKMIAVLMEGKQNA